MKNTYLCAWVFLLLWVVPITIDAQVWAWHNPKPSGEDLRAIHGLSTSTNLYAVGDFGCVLLYDGATWKNLPTPFTYKILGIWAYSPIDIFAVAQQGVLSPAIILHYDGVQWTFMDPGSASATATLHDIWGTAPDDVYAVGGTAKHYDGVEWTRMNSAITTNMLDIMGFSATEIFSVGPWGVLTCDGSLWTSIPNPPGNHSWSGIWGPSANNLFVVGSSDVEPVARYNGSIWSQVPTGLPTNSHLNAVWGEGGAIYAVGDGGLIAEFISGSGQWPEMVSGTELDLNDIWGPYSDRPFVVGNGGVLLEYSGGEWQGIDGSITGVERITGFWASDPTNLYAIGWNETFIHNDGTGWSTIELPPLFSPVAISGYQTDTGVLVYLMSRYDVYVYDGIGFTDLDITGSSGFLTDIQALNLNTLLVSSDSYQILRFSGGTWSTELLPTMPSGISGEISALCTTDPLEAHAVGKGGLSLELKEGVWSLHDTHVTDDLIDVWGSRSSYVFAISQNQIIYFDGLGWHPEFSDGPLFGISGTDSSVFVAKAVTLNATQGAILEKQGLNWPETLVSGQYMRGIWCDDAVGSFIYGDNMAIMRNVDNIDCSGVFDIVDPGNGVNEDDFREWLSMWPQQSVPLDIDGNGRIDIHEFIVFKKCYPR